MMSKNRLAALSVIAVISVAAMACTVSIPGLRMRPGFVPEIQSIQTSETREESLFVGSRTDVVDVDIDFGAGELTIEPGGEGLLTGSAVYNVEELAPVLTETENRISLSTGDLDFDYLPTNIEGGLENEWDLQLGNSPMNLDLDIGAAAAGLDLGGLSLENLSMNIGAADLTMDISSPLAAEMARFDLEAGASSLQLLHLGNLNARRISINSAAGDFRYDFTGQLQTDVYAEISMAAGYMRITVPEDASVSIELNSAMMDVDMEGSWSRNGAVYTRDGDVGTIVLKVTAGAGQIEVILD